MDKWIFHTSAHSVKATKEIIIQNNMKNVSDLEADAVKQILLTSLRVIGLKACKISVWLTLQSWRWRHYIHPKHQALWTTECVQPRRLFSSRYIFFGVMSRHGVAERFTVLWDQSGHEHAYGNLFA
jgi:hypothetical protein